MHHPSSPSRSTIPNHSPLLHPPILSQNPAKNNITEIKDEITNEEVRRSGEEGEGGGGLGEERGTREVAVGKREEGKGGEGIEKRKGGETLGTRAKVGAGSREKEELEAEVRVGTGVGTKDRKRYDVRGFGSPGLSPDSIGLGGQSLNISQNMLNTVYINKKFPASKEVFCLKGEALAPEHVPKTAYEKLMTPGLFIKQKVEVFEILAGIQKFKEMRLREGSS